MSINTIKYTSPMIGSSTDDPQAVEGTTTSGGQSVLLIADMTSRQLLEGILIELKKLNLRQEEVFEETVTDEDISCE